MFRAGFVGALVATCAAASAVHAQSVSLTSGTATGDCSGTSFSQAADASGKFLSAEWAAAGQFPVAINRGRHRCTIRVTVAVQAGYKVVTGGGNGNALRIAIAQVAPLRLNGSASGALIESTVSIDNGAPAVGGSVSNGGAMTSASLTVDRAASAPLLESACSSTAKGTFIVTSVVDVAAASNYVVPWPPEPYTDRETASMSMYRLYYTVVPCTTRSVSPTRGL